MSPTLRLALLAVVALAILLLLGYFLSQWRMTPAQREKSRRLKLNILGRMHDGWLMDAEGSIVHYKYCVNGVDYNTSQDVSQLRALVPEDASLIVGPVTLKYLVRNPANSIVICETWSGLRIRPPKDEPAIASKEINQTNEENI